MNNPEIEVEILDNSDTNPELVQENSTLDSMDDDEFISLEEAIEFSGISKSLFYQRKKALGIESVRRGQKSYLKVCEARSIRDYSAGLAVAGNSSIATEQPTKVASVTGVNPNKIKQRATSIAKELVIADLLGEQLAANPELLSEEDRAEIDAYRSHFEAAFPKKEFSPEQLTELVIPLNKTPAQEEDAEEYLEVC